MNIDGAGARKGLIGKTGVMPARSRHCNGEQIQEMPLGRKPWEGLEERRSRARRTACLTITARPTNDGKGIRQIELLFGCNSKHSIVVGGMFSFVLDRRKSGS